MNKGIVMEMSENTIIVMSPNGRFEKLPRGTRNCEVGEEILLAPAKPRMKVPKLAIASSLAAAIVLCFVLVSTLTGTLPSGQVVAYVSIDINPSVEMGIDNEEVVRDLRGSIRTVKLLYKP
ncbi:anti-sigma factor domain-containing protein [Paenibacillus hexagrammi]|uniref:Anti-sigma factor domain-containing protein n=1 Tax=Paenibacillus hexagrammi TaxID=2908839 RepID=A0ABY3SMH5_9BACL|nr:anti-sigma factor domain-containing protein [Paenibacillus sp. YPD9-1]UJF34401.1 anti-sigma factor domain-containing protein [Paenibacillus sp. YPD9-1]